MNSLVLHIWIALTLDCVLGDPRWLPHPVRIVGRTAQVLERPLRRLVRSQRFAGIVMAATVVGGTALATWGMLAAAAHLSSALRDLAAVWVLYTSFAARDLALHSRAVVEALEARDLAHARHCVSRMVGRDTQNLDEPAIIRATVESVAENTVDGILAPLFFAVLFGPVAAMAYKAANTLDSTFGYRNERYLYFGWASAKIDDIANYIPARLSLVFVSIGASVSGAPAGQVLRIGLRDAGKHRSPNAGYPEAAFAGALGVQLGGTLFRNNRPHAAPRLGDPVDDLRRRHIHKANALMVSTTMTAALLIPGTRFLLEAMLR